MDVGGNHGSEDGLQEIGFAARLPEWARERADGQWYGPPPTERSSRQAKPKVTTKLILIVPDEDEDEWVKARLFDNPEQATALVQTLVEGGLAPERVSIFGATQMVVDVAYEPVVELKKRRKRSKPRG